MQVNVLEYFERSALARFRDKVAIRERAGQYTFGELERYAKNCAALILKRVEAANQPIAVFLPKSAQAVIAALGSLYSGNCYANLDVKSPPQRLKRVLQSLEAPVIVTNAAHASVLRAAGIEEKQLMLIERSISDKADYDDRLLQKRIELIIDTDPAYILFTSGSTGVPKGVIIPHRGIIDYIDWAKKCYDISDREVIGNQAPFFFDNSTLDIYLCFACGASLVLIPEDVFAYLLKLVEFIREMAVTTIFWVPPVLTSIANFKILDAVRLPPLKKILFAGEVMPTRTLNYWRRWYPKALFSNLYGPTEITVDCTYYVVERDFTDDEPLPIGFPCRNTDILILNEQHQPAAIDEPGELCVRGSSLALGYWNNPEKTAQAFVQNPLNSRYPERIYRTGDLVYRNHRGEIMFLGRKDFQIKHLGYRIELGEIEHAALQFEEIRNCCVLYNQNKKEIVLFYESGKELPPAFIRERLLSHVPKYMLPSVFHRLDAMPLNGSGKIDRQTLLAAVK